MIQDNRKLFFIGLIFVATIGFGIANIFWAVECWDKGGAYITGNSMWPICVKAERL